MAISYNDFPFVLKVSTLKNFFNSDKDAYVTITNLAESINENLDINISYIEELLISGYLSFEKIYDEKYENVIGIKQLEFSSLIPYYNDNKMLWIQYPDSHFKRVLSDEQIYFLSYNKSKNNMGFSLADLLYRKMIDSSDTVYLNTKKRKMIHELLKINKEFLK